MNNSWERNLATKPNQRLIKVWPITKMSTRATVILMDAAVRAKNRSPGFLPSEGNKINRKTTAKS